MKTVLMDFSGIYKQENFYQGKEAGWIDFQDLSGVNCYCTQEAEEEIRKRIACCPLKGIHFLDSGNYHYLSKFWLEKAEEPCDLLVFDHHTDMQESAFFGLLSCGSWVREVLHGNPQVRNICVAGPALSSFSECEKEDRERICAVSGRELREGELQGLQRFLEEGKRPLYLSIDKDILSKKDARTNWDQGEVRLLELFGCLELVFRKRKVLGVDICGENPQDTSAFPSEEEFAVNSRTNRRLWEFLEARL